MRGAAGTLGAPRPRRSSGRASVRLSGCYVASRSVSLSAGVCVSSASLSARLVMELSLGLSLSVPPPCLLEVRPLPLQCPEGGQQRASGPGHRPVAREPRWPPGRHPPPPPHLPVQSPKPEVLAPDTSCSKVPLREGVGEAVQQEALSEPELQVGHTPSPTPCPPVPGAGAEEDAGAIRGPPAVGVLTANTIPRADGDPSPTVPYEAPLSVNSRSPWDPSAQEAGYPRAPPPPPLQIRLGQFTSAQVVGGVQASSPRACALALRCGLITATTAGSGKGSTVLRARTETRGVSVLYICSCHRL